MTENCASFARTWIRDAGASGTVGSIMPNTELKLIDVPSMGYSAEDKPFPRGEICMRGEQRFTCYYKGLPEPLFAVCERSANVGHRPEEDG